MSELAVKRQKKMIDALQALKSTGISLMGRRFGKSNNGCIVRDPSFQLEEVVTFPGITKVHRWGRFRQYGNSRTSLVAELRDGTQFWFQLKDQDHSNQNPLQRLLKSMPKPSSPSCRSVSITWYC